MGQWKNEDDIKAELRTLTGELKQLREELQDLVAPPKTHPSRAFLHRRSWPAPRAHAADQSPDANRRKPSKPRRR